MAVSKLREVIALNGNNLALLIGNGINRYRNSAQLNSWDDLLMKIAANCSTGVDAVPKGTTLTEFYDVLELASDERTSNLQGEFCDLMKDWAPVEHHKRVMGWAAARGAPVITTNFDTVLSQAADAHFQRFGSEGFTDYYPWDCYYAPRPIPEPCGGFGIWHLNGMARYKRSIRLGLTHYMGSVQRARGWLHRDEAPLFAGKNMRNWSGALTWMDVVFNKPLLLIGLALEENEVFVRWLLIERARYFRKFPDRRHPAWFAYRPDRTDDRQAGKLFFLKAVGFTCIPVDSYDELYSEPTWKLP